VLLQPEHASRGHFKPAIRHKEAGRQELGGKDAFAAPLWAPQLQPRPHISSFRSVQDWRRQPVPHGRATAPRARGGGHERGGHALRRCCANQTGQSRNKSVRRSQLMNVDAAKPVLSDSERPFDGAEAATGNPRRSARLRAPAARGSAANTVPCL
jgi:hypothetical protein